MSCIQLIALQWRLMVVVCYLLLRRRYHIESPVWLCAVRLFVCLSVRTSRDNRVLVAYRHCRLSPLSGNFPRSLSLFNLLPPAPTRARGHDRYVRTSLVRRRTYLPDTYAATTSLCCCSQCVDESDNNSRRFLICIYVHCVSKNIPDETQCTFV